MREKMFMLPVLPLDTISSSQVATSPDNVTHICPPALFSQIGKTKTQRCKVNLKKKKKAWNRNACVLCRSLTCTFSFPQ